MKLAIMQPYFFPYLGYFQLIHAVDTFVFYDDVTFRKQGWINRNRILIGGSPGYFSVPLRGASSSVAINRTAVDHEHLSRWRRKFLRTLAESYTSSGSRNAVLGLVEAVLDVEAPNIASLAQRSVRVCCEYLDLETRFLTSSGSFPASGRTGVGRILEICMVAGASVYVNPPGGRALYDRTTFGQAGIALRILAPQLDVYPQPAGTFVPGLSIIDVLMRLDRPTACAAARRGILE